MPLGSVTNKVSDREELLKAASTSGHGAPGHTPEAASQTYVDVDSGQKYEWWAGTWH